jgi:hypothetical protein
MAKIIYPLFTEGNSKCHDLHTKLLYYKPESIPLNLHEAFNQFLSNGSLIDIINDNRKIQGIIFNDKSIKWLASKNKFNPEKSNNNLYFKNNITCEKFYSKKISSCIIILIICWDIFPHLQTEILKLIKTKLKFKNPILFLYFLLINMINISPIKITSIYIEMSIYLCSVIDNSNTKSIKIIQSIWNEMISIYFPIFVIQDEPHVVLLFLKLFSYSHMFNDYIEDKFIIISIDELKEKFYGDLNIFKIILKFERIQKIKQIEKYEASQAKFDKLQINFDKLINKYDILMIKFDELQSNLNKIKSNISITYD